MSDEQAVMTAREMTEALNRTADELASANKYGRTNRRMIWITIVSLILDLALTVVVAVLAVQGNHASHAAESAQASSRNLCLAGNTARREQLDIWTFFLSLVPPPKTAADAHAEALLRARLRTDLAPRNCASLGMHK